MKQKSNSFTVIYILFALFILAGIFLIQSCGMEDIGLQPKGNYISGYAIFVDTTWYQSGGHYAVVLYNKVQNPFTYNPVIVKNIDVSIPNPSPAYWRIDNNAVGEYYLAVVWIRNTGSLPPVVLGTYGCDTNHACSVNGTVIAFPNYSGANYNLKCFSDTTKGLN